MEKKKWLGLLTVLLILVTSTAYAGPRRVKTGTWADRTDGVDVYLAAYEGDLPRIKELVKSGAPLNVKMTHGITPLHGAATAGHLGVVKCLVENGAEINVLDDDKMTPLDFAGQHKDIVEYLKSKGAKTGHELRKK